MESHPQALSIIVAKALQAARVRERKKREGGKREREGKRENKEGEREGRG
jgi:hypothetical protein